MRIESVLFLVVGWNICAKAAALSEPAAAEKRAEVTAIETDGVERDGTTTHVRCAAVVEGAACSDAGAGSSRHGGTVSGNTATGGQMDANTASSELPPTSGTNAGALSSSSSPASTSTPDVETAPTSDDDKDWVVLASEPPTDEDQHAAEEGGEKAEDNSDADNENLAPTLPPSSSRKRWGILLGVSGLLTLGCIAYIYRSSLPHPFSSSSSYTNLTDHIPLLSTFGLSSSSSNPTLPNFTSSGKRFRPAAKTLFRWSTEDDPEAQPPSRHSARSGKEQRTRNRSLSRSGSGGSRKAVFYLGDLTEEEETEFEEVGLLPSPAGYGREGRRDYGSFGSSSR